jgi:hypothetical protein
MALREPSQKRVRLRIGLLSLGGLPIDRQRPPPEQNDPNLENLVVRIEDGTILAKSHGAYWDLGSEIAKAYLMTAWSPDSRLLVKAEHRVESVSAELFAFGENDAAAGPLDSYLEDH